MSPSEAAIRGRARRYADKQVPAWVTGSWMRTLVYRAYIAGARSSRRKRA